MFAPLVLFSDGFFTANALISSSYTWTRTSQTMDLTRTVFIFSREFVYKEQRSRHIASDPAWPAVRYSCALPYVMSLLAMAALWAL